MENKQKKTISFEEFIKKGTISVIAFMGLFALLYYEFDTAILISLVGLSAVLMWRKK